jgi:hypothetical protein
MKVNFKEINLKINKTGYWGMLIMRITTLNTEL